MKVDDTLEIEAHLPAVLLGQKVSEVVPALEELTEAPPWLVWWQHQHGGYACSQAQLAGLLLPLSSAPIAQATRSELVEALRALGAERKSYERDPLCQTFGKPYSQEQLVALNGLLPAGLPELRGGAEALAEFDPAACHTFTGWPILAYELPEKSHLADSDSHHVAFGPRQITMTKAVDATLLEHVAEFFVAVGINKALHAFLVWFNSD